MADSRVVDVIVKLFSKFWTKNNTIEGECTQQVLMDGSKSYMHDGLLFELKDFYTIDNVAIRSNEKNVSAPSHVPIERPNVPLAGLEFGRPKQVTIPEKITPDNVHKF